MKLVVGLGNPGARYASTRHNVGFRVVDCLAARRGIVLVADDQAKSRAWSAELATPGGSVVLAKPRTYMNRSGRAAPSKLGRNKPLASNTDTQR